ncbi:MULTISPECIES: sigma-54 dependent transcriptional regulator [unclassified Mucilaginibacter]|uniref:sigma-54-dependent transcriptional regulator n=1 Tax=unclassified Mucilaginibacter TaxID=2617802 RepID=UPI002AC9ACE3|nr:MULTISPECIES: sigma-54 dependent transcriptional regulator [unclassified Mucilaginibacter]MEB0262502.1 sigma-54 dependent transcriptional regulator [Mucilaginibacter sp. 10I4]MEB0279942.1 sigma-54 dependent transcriptional regulator [Mucilaginibacter sp. 10B2]MEB0300088.1 sigma-54 dependent transcriptional regulator [Mucilaginibacter sp. 5C4]WPX21900.1 sigma-54 dependent transcriptional regulator [Mucilaginibacter sp. 5C4]
MILKKATVLIVDDDPDVLTAVKLLLKTETKEIITEKNPENINWLLQKNEVDLVLLDMNYNSAINTGNEGIYWLRKIKEWKPNVCVIMITAYGDIDLAVRSLKEGANDFVVKPWHNEKLIDTIKDLLDKKEGGGKSTKASVKGEGGEKNILGDSEVMEDIFHKVNKIAPTDANILILGENGTGKDLMAKAIHERSLRADKPFVKVDVGALTDSLFESELFGHKKGAYTDAREDRMGRFEEAEGGTLFLDEIGNISLQQQAKLLTVLQNRHVTRLGTNKAVDINIRLICATNVPLQELANENKFRKDLIYRINTVEINMPPLRKRAEDIVVLAKHFAKIYATKYLKPAIDFDAAALNKLRGYSYPGNVRELQYTIERAVIMADDQHLKADDLLFSVLESPGENIIADDNIQLSTLEKNAILRVIEKHNGNITRAAKELGLTRTALYRRLSKYDI